MGIFRSPEGMIGRTPLLRMRLIEERLSLSAELICKMEMYNPCGSVKDRAALAVIDTAEIDGMIKPGGRVIEATSGNFGIALAMVALRRGYSMTAVMPRGVSGERISLLSALGAKIILTEREMGMAGARKGASELARADKNAYFPDQFNNFAPVLAHRQGTAEEILTDLGGAPDLLICGVGSGATLMGVGGRLKEINPKMQIIAVEPSGSAVLSTGVAGKHKIEGLGAGFMPPLLDMSLIDSVISVDDEDAVATARLVASVEGILCGISSGAVLSAMIRLGKMDENRGKRLLTILPDGGERYLSAGIYANNIQT